MPMFGMMTPDYDSRAREIFGEGAGMTASADGRYSVCVPANAGVVHTAPSVGPAGRIGPAQPYARGIRPDGDYIHLAWRETPHEALQAAVALKRGWESRY